MKLPSELGSARSAARTWLVVWFGFLACSPGLPPASPEGGRAGTEPEVAPPAASEGRPGSDSDDPPEQDGDDDNDLLHDDAPEDFEQAHSGGELRAHPLDGWSSERIDQALASNPSSLGCMSLGSPNAGALLNGVEPVESELFKLVSPGTSWATAETLEYLSRAVRAVHEEFPGTAPLMLGDISAKRGGPLRPHISHQSGRDVDISYYYVNGATWYARGTAKNLDLPRTWAFVRALIAETDVDLILIDHSIQALLREHARKIGEDAEWLESIFKGGAGMRPIIRHARGHATHIHVRFFNPIAQETARRAYNSLVRHKLIPPQHAYVHHRVKNGETLGMLAKKYGTTVRAIQNANRLRGTRIRAKAVYAIPVAGTAKPRLEPLRVPARRVPPIRRKLASTER